MIGLISAEMRRLSRWALGIQYNREMEKWPIQNAGVDFNHAFRRLSIREAAGSAPPKMNVVEERKPTPENARHLSRFPKNGLPKA